MQSNFVILLIAATALGDVDLNVQNNEIPPIGQILVTCAVSNSSGYVTHDTLGEICYVEFTTLPGSCWVYEHSPPTYGAASIRKNGCGGVNKIRVICNTKLCNVDAEIIKDKIENGYAVCGGETKRDCRKQLLVSLAVIQKSSTTTAQSVVLP